MADDGDTEEMWDFLGSVEAPRTGRDLVLSLAADLGTNVRFPDLYGSFSGASDVQKRATNTPAPLSPWSVRYVGYCAYGYNRAFAQGSPDFLSKAVDLLRESFVDPQVGDRGVTIKLIEQALESPKLTDSANQQDFVQNVNEARQYLTCLRNIDLPLEQNISLRNAEYYLLGDWAGVTNSVMWSIAIETPWIYRGLKAIGYRSNPLYPATPPGGEEWARAGLFDGWTSIPGAKLRLRSYPY